MKRIEATILMMVLFCTSIMAIGNNPLEGDITLFVANDTGRNGYYKQKPVAELMGEMADELGPEAVLAAGDVHHFEGVQSVDDPLWLTNYELIYSHPELMIPWYPILGNHEYRGNTRAVIDYSDKSRRWVMPDRYYTVAFEDDGTSIRVVMLDTTPMIDKYRNDSITYPDACRQNYEAQLQWADSVLNTAKEDWVVVVGHHPIYAETSKAESERKDLQNRLDPILRKYKVDAYINGHIHNFQHIEAKDSPVKYITNSSASLSRKVKPIEGTEFCSPDEGFSVITVNKDNMAISMIDHNGKIIHMIPLKK